MKPSLLATCAADQLVELNLIGGRNDFAVAVVDFKLRRRDFGVVLFVLETHRALHFGGGVDKGTQRIARQRVIVAAGVDVFKLPRFVIAALGVRSFEQEAFDFVGCIQRVAFFFVQSFAQSP